MWITDIFVLNQRALFLLDYTTGIVLFFDEIGNYDIDVTFNSLFAKFDDWHSRSLLSFTKTHKHQMINEILMYFFGDSILQY